MSYSPLQGRGFAPLAQLLATARAVAFVHQAAHWQTRGGHFYGDHLLFERLYNESQDFIDELAERTVGSGALPLVGTHPQISAIRHAIDRQVPQGANTPQQLVQISFEAERALVELSDLHEQFIYLLQQRLSVTP